jgi:hypothetical protein
MKTKKEFKYFSIFNHEKEQDYFRQMHKHGWKFIKVTGFGTYHFEECQPEDVVYQLDFNQEGLENREEYVQMFKDCGWNYVTEMAGYTYFREAVADMKDEEENIFSDDASKMDMIERVFKGRVGVLIILFCGVIVPQLFMQWNNSSSVGMAPFVCFLVLFVVYLIIFIKFVVMYLKVKKRLER